MQGPDCCLLWEGKCKTGGMSITMSISSVLGMPGTASTTFTRDQRGEGGCHEAGQNYLLWATSLWSLDV
jgi:hypothetical protein